MCFCFQAEDGIRDLVRSRGLGDVYKRQLQNYLPSRVPSNIDLACNLIGAMIGAAAGMNWGLSLIHI